MTDTSRYAAFGRKLTELRTAANIRSQAELATRLNRAQQSVSRWEAGTSRPKCDEIAGLAAVLETDANELMEIAGYEAVGLLAGTVTFDRPFPLDNLHPDTFERFITYLVYALHPDADVHRAGTSGHKQDGLDVTATLSTGKVHSYQCKRVQTFGPADVRKAIAAHTARADKRFLVLSRVASPKARDEISKHAGWAIWDKEDLSQIVRTRLTPEAQDRIVDTFFPGRRFELLGRSEPGPWLTRQRFFEAFDSRDAAFSHGWALKGREDELAALAAALGDAGVKFTLLIAAGGLGKSRLIKEAVTALESSHPATYVLFLSPTASASAADLEALGTGDKLVVVDDAHDRDDLGPLLEHAAIPANHTRILLATRPYGAERVKGLAARVGLLEPRVLQIERLTRKELKELAGEVLAEFEADPTWADHVVNVSGDSPLITVMAARIIAKDQKPPALTSSNEAVRNYVLGKFEKVVVGDLGNAADQPMLARLMELIALVQPFDIQDPYFNQIVEGVLGYDAITGTRLMRLLSDGGIIFKRGRHYRLMPDVLGDYLVERSCVDADGRLSPFAAKAFDAAQDKQIGRVLMNLGRLDWRRNEGDPSESTMLDGIWSRLDGIEHEWDTRLDAAYDVASYQPRQALEFVQRYVEAGRKFSDFPKILRRIAYTGRYFEEACELLWEIGRKDRRELGPHPEHALRILSELVGLEERKPVEISIRAFEFGMGLLGRDDVWDGTYTPLDVVAPMFKADGTTTESHFDHFTISPFLIRYDLVQPHRARLIDRMLELMAGENPRAGQRAAQLLESALRAPMSTMGSIVPDALHERYQAEFVETLGKVEAAMQTGLGPAVLISIARAISWHATYADGPTSEPAKALLARLPTDLEFRTWTALVDGYGQVFLGRWDAETWEARVTKWIGDLVTDLKARLPEPEQLRVFIEKALVGLREAGLDRGSSHVLMSSLLRDDLALCHAMLADTFTRPDSPTAHFASIAITEVLTAEPTAGRELVRKMLASEDAGIRRMAGTSMAGLRRNPDSADFALLLEVVAHDDPDVVGNGIRSSFGWRKDDPVMMRSLMRSANIGGSAHLADELCMMLRTDDLTVLKSMDAEDVKAFLGKLYDVPVLEGHWINEVLAALSEHHALATAQFFFDRVERYAVEETFNSARPVNHGPYSHVKLRFRDSPDFPEVLRRTWDWLKAHENAGLYFQEYASYLFDAMFLSIDGAVVSMFAQRVEEGTSDDLLLIARLIRKTPPAFVFNERAFVAKYLDRCKLVDQQLLKRAMEALYLSGVSGMRSGTPGQPAPQDVTMRDRATEAMAKVSRLSPAYRLYKDIHAHALFSIERWTDIERDDDL